MRAALPTVQTVRRQAMRSGHDQSGGAIALSGPLSVKREVQGLALLIALVWVCVGLFVTGLPLADTILVPGVVTVPDDRKAVQHPDGGVVSEILVRDGDRVKSGQTLLRLDGARLHATLAAAHAQRCSLAAQRRRLLAEAGELLPKRLEVAPSDRDEPNGCSSSLEVQDRLMVERQENLRDKLRSLDRAMGLARDVIAAARSRAEELQSLFTLASAELSDASRLFSSRDTTVTRVRAAQRDQIAAKADMAANALRIDEADLRLADLSTEQKRVQHEFLEQVLADQVALDRSLTEIDDRIDSLNDQIARLTIAAPEGGRVLGLVPHAPGAVAAGGSTLLWIVPDEEPPIVQAEVRPQDAGSVVPGLVAHLRTREASGRAQTTRAVVQSISPDRLQDKFDRPFFLVKLAFDANAGEMTGTLRQGMAVDVVITTGTRTVLQALAGYWTTWLQTRRRG